MTHSFQDQPHTRAQGRLGEDEAVAWLLRQGFRVVARNVRTRGEELDLIATEGEVLCFVEIKARATGTYGPAIEAISATQQRRIARAAALYLVRKPWPGPCRFDVVALDLIDGAWRFTLVRDAFQIS